MKTGVIAPTERELAPFLASMMDVKTERIATMEFHSGRCKNAEVVAVMCGVCKVNAAVATQILTDKMNVSQIVLTGVAGAIDRRLNIFDTIIGAELAHHDIEDVITSQFSPWNGNAVFKADKRLTDAILRANDGYGLTTGRIVTGETFIHEDGRQEIIERFSPLAVDMESAAVAQACLLSGIPFAVIRTMSDTPKESGFDVFDKNCAKAAERSVAVLMRYLESI